MKKLKMAKATMLTFEEGCNIYLGHCRQRNLRQGTINQYKQSYTQFYKFFDPDTPIEDIDEASDHSFFFVLSRVNVFLHLCKKARLCLTETICLCYNTVTIYFKKRELL